MEFFCSYFMYICNQDGNLKIWDFGMLAVSNMWIP